MQSDEQLIKYIDVLVGERLAPHEELIVHGMESSPRQIKRLLNRLAFLVQAQQSKFRELDTGLILKLPILQMRWPDLFRAVRARPSMRGC